MNCWLDLVNGGNRGPDDGDSADFDATTVDPLLVAFGPDGAREAHGKELPRLWMSSLIPNALVQFMESFAGPSEMTRRS
jgi:hypothetical protein